MFRTFELPEVSTTGRSPRGSGIYFQACQNGSVWHGAHFLIFSLRLSESGSEDELEFEDEYDGGRLRGTSNEPTSTPFPGSLFLVYAGIVFVLQS
jgi:hypothetical protein